MDTSLPAFDGAVGWDGFEGKSPRSKERGLFGCGTRIRTATNRFRDCRATLTQFRNVLQSVIYYTG